MTKTIFTIIFSVWLSSSYSQDAKTYYDKGLELAQQGKAEEAIKYFDKSIEIRSDEYVAWYNRGITKVMLNLYEDALTDFDRTIILSPGYKKAYLNRGNAKKHLTDYDGAMADINFAIRLDSIFGEAYYDRALLENLLGRRVPACLDFEKALKLGYKNAQPKMERCIQRPTADTSIHSILRLSRTSDNDKYGFTPENPVKVGMGPEGGPNNARTYLELLRDAKGRPVKYERVGTCCPYESKHALYGKQALEDKYDLTYTGADGRELKTFVYITFYDYEEPLILAGMRTIHVSMR